MPILSIKPIFTREKLVNKYWLSMDIQNSTDKLEDERACLSVEPIIRDWVSKSLSKIRKFGDISKRQIIEDNITTIHQAYVRMCLLGEVDFTYPSMMDVLDQRLLYPEATVVRMETIITETRTSGILDELIFKFSYISMEPHLVIHGINNISVYGILPIKSKRKNNETITSAIC